MTGDRKAGLAAIALLTVLVSCGAAASGPEPETDGRFRFVWVDTRDGMSIPCITSSDLARPSLDCDWRQEYKR